MNSPAPTPRDADAAGRRRAPTRRPGAGRMLCALLRGALLRGALLSGLGLSACTGPNDTGKLPPDVPDPITLQTPAGAMARYRNVLQLVPRTYDSLLTLTGILTDELADLPIPLGAAARFTRLDSRQDLSDFAPVYNSLHLLRGEAREARGFLRAYAPSDSTPALAGHLFGLEGYAEVFLADVFCSGIPLSTVDFGADYTLTPGFSTDSVYRHATALFDSALALTGDRAAFQSLAAVGKGRALLALGQYAAAAAAVAAVPDDYRYQVIVPPSGTTPLRLFERFTSVAQQDFGYQTHGGTPSVADQEGHNGLDYRASGDPRTLATLLGPDSAGFPMYFPAKYPQSGAVTLTLADGVEARLIEAEAALQAGDVDTWLAKLNHLRETAWPTIVDCSSGTCQPGASAALPDTTDPGTAAGRIDLMFRERAFWLFLTAHRQGDLRRLIRRPEYSRPPATVYPSGDYPGGSGTYGTQVVAPVPAEEQQLNPKYTGCVNFNA